MSSLTNSNPLMNSAALDDFQPRPKPTNTSAQVDTTRAEKATVRQTAQDRGFVIDNLAAVVRAKRNNNGKASKAILSACIYRTSIASRPGATTITIHRLEALRCCSIRFSIRRLSS